MKTRMVFFMVVLFCTFSMLILYAQQKKERKQIIKITFINKVNQQPVLLNNTLYTNFWKETFTVSKLKYYISNISFQTKGKKDISEKNSYHLINQEEPQSLSFSFLLVPDDYESISFLVGVDSIKNVSGAQTNALDPLNGMFWTWNTGYIMFKMEGFSEQSTLVNKKIAYHIGGFTGPNNVLRKVKLNFKEYPIILKKQTFTEIIIQADIDKIWSGINKLTIHQTAVCTTPGALAASIADNYAAAFKIIEVINP